MGKIAVLLSGVHVAWREELRSNFHGVCKKILLGSELHSMRAGGRGSTIRGVKEVQEAEEVKEKRGVDLRTVSVHSTK